MLRQGGELNNKKGKPKFITQWEEYLALTLNSAQINWLVEPDNKFNNN